MKNLIIIIALLSFLYCSTSTDTSDKIALPLKVGNSWTYNYISTNLRSNTVTKEGQAIFTITKDTLVNGIHWFLIEGPTRTFSELLGGYYSNQGDGIHRANYYYDSLSDTLKTQPFLHHPDEKIPNRFIKNSTSTNSISYLGEKIDSDSGLTTQEYTRTHFQQVVGEKNYTFLPYDFSYSFSNEVGFQKFENGYTTIDRNFESDEGLILKMTFLTQFELLEFNEN